MKDFITLRFAVVYGSDEKSENFQKGVKFCSRSNALPQKTMMLKLSFALIVCLNLVQCAPSSKILDSILDSSPAQSVHYEYGRNYAYGHTPAPYSIGGPPYLIPHSYGHAHKHGYHHQGYRHNHGKIQENYGLIRDHNFSDVNHSLQKSILIFSILRPS